MSHICKEILEPSKPPLAYLYPTASVVIVLRVFGVSASLPHMHPDCKFWRLTKPVGGAICGEGFAAQTPTGFGSPAQEILPEDGSDLPAFTLTDPSGVLLRSVAERYNCESPVFLPNHIHGHNPSQQHTITPTYISVKVHYV